MPIALIAHGGAGNWRPGSEQDALEGLRAAVQAGEKILREGGSALDAVCATVVVLEDNPIYNAGTGGVLNFDGFVELDASVMESRGARVGAVSGLQRVKNPVLVARRVMDETDHVMLTGEGAQRFARVMGFPAVRTGRTRRRTWTRSSPAGARSRCARSSSSIPSTRAARWALPPSMRRGCSRPPPPRAASR
jgi:beta-aspartyl-peptidase (threonine type)